MSGNKGILCIIFLVIEILIKQAYAQEIPIDLDLSDTTITTTAFFTASNSINAGPNFTVSNNGHSTLITGNYIILKPLFSIIKGGSFNAIYDRTVTPVELSFFSFCLSENNVILTWETTSETNNFGFEIERKSNSGYWEKIGFVQGNGTTNINKKYSFTDHSILKPGNYFYRLKQMDADGTFEYSAELEVYLDLPKQYLLSDNYPNPFNPETTIKYQLPKSVQVEIKIYNALGQEIRMLLNENRVAGYHQIIWDGKDNSGRTVGTGTYLYQMKTADFIDVKKMILIQ